LRKLVPIFEKPNDKSDWFFVMVDFLPLFGREFLKPTSQGLKSALDDIFQALMKHVVGRILVKDKFVARRNSHIDADSIGVSRRRARFSSGFSRPVIFLSPI
jgi:hypothetical protein